LGERCASGVMRSKRERERETERDRDRESEIVDRRTTDLNNLKEVIDLRELGQVDGLQEEVQI
jgi:hypothetical protein